MSSGIERDDTQFYVREVPWHGFGECLQEAATSKIALKKSGLDWKVIQQQAYFKTPDGKFRKVENHLYNVRETDLKVLGDVASNYHLLQNEDAFKFTDELLGEGVKYETAGSLFGGKRIWILAILPEKYKALDDEIKAYFCLSNSFDCCSGVRGMITPTRVVCWNTLNMAIKNATRTWTIYHNQSIEKKVDKARQALDITRQYYAKFSEEAEKLADIKVDYDKLVKELFPFKEGDNPITIQTAVQKQKDLLTLLERPDLKAYKNTGWGFVNGVSDMATHPNPSNKVKDVDTWKQNRMAKVMDGFDILDDAYVLVLKQKVKVPA